MFATDLPKACTTCCDTAKLCILPPEGLHVFREVLRRNSNCLSAQYIWLVCLVEGKCFTWGRNCVFCIWLFRAALGTVWASYPYNSDHDVNSETRNKKTVKFGTHLFYLYLYFLLGRPIRRWEDNIEMDLRELVWEAWTGSIWLRLGTDGGLLWMRQWKFGFHKVQGISLLAEDLLASQEGIFFLSLVSLFLC